MNDATDSDINWGKVLSLEDLLSFSRQISCGMSYLGQKDVIHRDLAASNQFS